MNTTILNKIMPILGIANGGVKICIAAKWLDQSFFDSILNPFVYKNKKALHGNPFIDYKLQ